MMFVRKVCKSPCQNRKSSCEIILVSRHQPHVAPALDSQRPVAIEFDFVFPIKPSGNFATGRHCIGSTNRAVSFARRFEANPGTSPPLALIAPGHEELQQS